MTTGARLIVVCGVRPHYVKAASLSRCLDIHGIRYALVDARQQYDREIVDLILDDLQLTPDYRLEHQSRDAAVRGGTIYAQLVKLLTTHSAAGRHPVVVGFGDTTTTAMTALAAISAGCAFVHLEAGVRANRDGIESVENRIRRMLGAVSVLNFCVLPEHVENLRAERVAGRSVWVGDIGRRLLTELAGSAPYSGQGEEILCHIHKTENVNPDGIRTILDALAVTGLPTLFVTHPSVARLMTEHVLRAPGNVKHVKPAGYRAAVARMRAARFILTDSGGVQREAYHLRRRCVVRRDTMGWGQLAGQHGHIRVGRSADEIVHALYMVWDDPQWRHPTVPGFDRPDGDRILAQELKALLDPLDVAGWP